MDTIKRTLYYGTAIALLLMLSACGESTSRPALDICNDEAWAECGSNKKCEDAVFDQCMAEYGE